ncbi:MAG: hypothetical protein KIT87_29970 [Anaerolineae bacterium]|nr:hypothetical protein [Anaerolineae bacterium]
MLQVEVVTHVLGSMSHCQHCQVFIDGSGVGGQVHQSDMESYPPEWRAEWTQLSDLIFRLTERYPGRLVVRIHDAQSVGGLWQAIRRGIRKYPTFIVGDEKYYGWDEAALDSLVRRKLTAV